ncbi:uncharacterized protein LOC132601625 [Lycium barbarum]|uniref:uncharacterized protein LOC132601625 n=1 Tax=Lycium barbarum TaxID=112863 RepID=UPI00293E998B|nr:uncharacterized protein LOC132601625 [Lycium barbarum]
MEENAMQQANNQGCLRWIFIHYLAISGRLATKDRLIKWSINCNPTCPLCENWPESNNHLFFQCPVTHEVWEKILTWQGIQRHIYTWDQEQRWANKHAHGNNARAEIYRMALSGCIYYTWQDRNMRVFQQKKRPTAALVKQIIQDIHTKGEKKPRIAKRLRELNFYP